MKVALSAEFVASPKSKNSLVGPSHVDFIVAGTRLIWR